MVKGQKTLGIPKTPDGNRISIQLHAIIKLADIQVKLIQAQKLQRGALTSKVDA